MTKDESYVDLYWIPVGAGTRFQRASLWLYEGVAAAVGRRKRAVLLHAALKMGVAEKRFTLEVMPSPPGQNVRNEVTGPVGVRGADRLRLFRYQVCMQESESLPDEAWAMVPPVRAGADAGVVSRVMELTAEVPAYTWGRRRKGHSEMWTSDSCVAWLLGRAGADVQSIAVPEGGRAPGWFAGIQELGMREG